MDDWWEYKLCRFYKGRRGGLEFVGFWTPRSGSEIPPNVNPSPLTHCCTLSLSLAEDLVGLRQEIPKRGRYNHSQRGIPDEGVIGSVGEEEDVGIGAIVTKWRENLKRGCLTFLPRTTSL